MVNRLSTPAKIEVNYVPVPNYSNCFAVVLYSIPATLFQVISCALIPFMFFSQMVFFLREQKIPLLR